MATRKILLVLGQSNATQVGDADSFETSNPTLDLRDGNQSGNSTWTMPDTFHGGPRAGTLGDEDIPGAGTYQSFSTRDSAKDNIRYLTFYNPAPSYSSAGQSDTADYPQRTKITSASTSSKLIIDNRTNSKARSYSATASGTLLGSAFTDVVVGDRVMLDSGFSGTSIDTTTLYWVVSSSSGDIEISLTQGGAALTPTGSGTVYHVNFGTITRASDSSTYTAWMDVNDDSALHVEPAFTSPEEWEQITYEYMVMDAPAAGEVILNARTGGIVTNGTLSDSTTADTGAANGTTYAYAGSRGTQSGLLSTPGREPAINDRITLNLAVGNNTSLSALANYYVVGLQGQQTLDVAVSRDNSTINKTGHGLCNRERVAATASSLGFAEKAVYLVNRIDDDNFSLTGPYTASTSGAAPTFTPSGTGSMTLTRIDASTQCEISTTLGGAPISWTESGATQIAVAQYLQAFEGSMSGMVLTGLSGTNLGDQVELAGCKLSAQGQTITEYVGSFTIDPQPGDILAINPPGGLDFDKWAYFLPWSPFEGRAKGKRVYDVDMGTINIGIPISASVVANAIGRDDLVDPLMISWTEGDRNTVLQEGDTVRFQSAPDPLTTAGTSNAFSEFGVLPGEEYQVSDISELHATLGVVYRPLSGDDAGLRFAFLKKNGQFVTDPTSGGTRTASTKVGMTVVRQDGRSNNAPPGFNFPQHYSLQDTYQAFAGDNRMSQNPRAAFSVKLAERMASYFGEPIYVIQHSAGDTSLETRTVPSAAKLEVKPFGWFDPATYLSWEQSVGTDLFDRLSQVLDAANTALTKDGDDGEVIAVVFAQGEADTATDAEANAYEANLTAFISDVESLIATKGLSPGLLNGVPFIQPKLFTEGGGYSAGTLTRANTVNEAMSTVDAADIYYKTTSVSGLSAMPDRVHYDGESMGVLGSRLFNTYIELLKGLPHTFTGAVDATASAQRPSLKGDQFIIDYPDTQPHDKMSGTGPVERSINTL